jgi:hypothetical protein
VGWWLGQLACNIVPFLGPSLAQLIPSPNSTEGSLQQAQFALTDAQCQLKSVVGAEVGALTTNICELAVTLFGTDTTCGYVQIAIEQASLPVLQRAILLSINVAFLAIIVVCVIILM